MGRSRCRSNCQGIYTLWFLKKLKRAGVPQSDFVYYYEAVIRSVMEYASPSLASHLNSQKHLKQFSNELVRSLLEAVHTAVTVLLLSWTACFRLQDVNSKPKNCSIRSSVSRNTAYITCYPLQENSLSLIVSDLPTNCHAYLQRLTDSKTLLCVIC